MEGLGKPFEFVQLSKPASGVPGLEPRAQIFLFGV